MKKILGLTTLLVISLNAATVEDKVEIESLSHKNRIAILQEAEKCIQNAKTKEEYKRCEKIEKDGRKKNKEELLEVKKEKLIQKLDKRILKIEQMKECIKNAQDNKAFQQCRPKKAKASKK